MTTIVYDIIQNISILGRSIGSRDCHIFQCFFEPDNMGRGEIRLEPPSIGRGIQRNIHNEFNVRKCGIEHRHANFEENGVL